MEADISTSKELYEKLLDNKKLFNVSKGFTIPFIIGAYCLRGLLKKEELQTNLCVKKLLEIILSTAQGKDIAISMCDDCNNNLILYYESQDVMTFRKSYPSINGIIYTDMNLEPQITTIEDMVNKIWEDCENNIKEKKFSIQDKEWKEFTQEEIEKINSL